MSQELMVYVGAYVEITKLPQIWEEVENEIFEHPSCTKKCDHSFLTTKSNFCPSCGNPIKLVMESIKEPRQWDMADISHEFDKPFFWVNGCGWGVQELDKILIPNGTGKWGKYYEDYGFGIKASLPQLNNPEGILKTKFTKDLARLEKMGAKYVLKTGILGYYV